MAKELKFEVVFASSSERSNDADIVTRELDQGDGWTSTRNCSFAQQLILEVEEDVNVTKIQVAPHHLFIPKKIEFGYCRDSASTVKDPRDLKFDPIGSLEFTKNGTYDETKTLFLDVTASFIRMRIQENYGSSVNKHNQVGITSLVLWGYSKKSKTKRRTSSADPENKMPPRRSLSMDFDSKPDPQNDTAFHSKDPSENIREAQKMLQEKKKKSLTLGRHYEARMATSAVELLIDAEQELQDLYQEKRRAQTLNNKSLADLCDVRAKKVHDDALGSIDLDKLLGRTEPPPPSKESSSSDNRDRLRSGQKTRLESRSVSRNNGSQQHRTFTAKARQRLQMAPTRRAPSPKRNSSTRRSLSASSDRSQRPALSGDWRHSPFPRNDSASPPPPLDPVPREPSPERAVAAPEGGSLAPSSMQPLWKEQHTPQKCPYCSEINPLFFSKTKLNKHFAETCPVLARCPQCTRAIEVWKLNEHFQKSCPMKEKFHRHQPCGITIQTSTEAEHEKNYCPKTQPTLDTAWCPLCSQAVKLPSFRNSWRKHLTGPSAQCTRNPRKYLHGVSSKSAVVGGQFLPDMAAASSEGGAEKKKKKKKKKKTKTQNET